MSYVALYRKYRPKNFDEILGQKAVSTTLKNQIKSGKIGHAYLFCGMRGTGKTSTARVLAKALNCEKGPTTMPCDECSSCRAISNGSMIDVVEMDAASNRGIDDIRDLREKVNFPPSEGRYKIYIIDEVHMLTTEAFNALLKTLEEPPRHVVFILATTEPSKLPQTILSRCMRFDFSRVSTPELVKHMQKIAAESGVEVEVRALAEIAKSSQGSVRDCLSLLDKALAFGGKKLSYEDALTLLGSVDSRLLYEISQAVLEEARAKILQIVDEVMQQGKDPGRFINDLTEHFRNILMVCIGADRDLVDVVDEEYAELRDISSGYTEERLLSILDILVNAANDLKWSSQPRIVLEAALVKITLPSFSENEQGIISRIQALEKGLEKIKQQLGNIKSGAEISVANPETVSDQKPINAMQSESPSLPGLPIEPPKADKTGLETKKIETNDAPTNKEEEILKTLQQNWPEVLNELKNQGKVQILTAINATKAAPSLLEKDQLYLSYQDGSDIFKDMLKRQKNIIEEIIKVKTGIEIIIKGFKNPDVKKNSMSDPTVSGDNNGNETIKKTDLPQISDDEFIQNVINFFGKDIVEIRR